MTIKFEILRNHNGQNIRVEIVKNDNRKKFKYEVSCRGIVKGAFASLSAAENFLKKIVERNIRTNWGRLAR